MANGDPTLRELIAQAGRRSVEGASMTLPEDYQKELESLRNYQQERLFYDSAYSNVTLPGGSVQTEIKGAPVSEYLKYGVNYLPNSTLNEEQRAAMQSGGEQLLHGAARVLPNAVFDFIGQTAAIADYKDYFNSDLEIGNAITSYMQELKEGFNASLPIYHKQSADMGHWSWWMDNGSALASSALSFAGTGSLIGRGLGAIKWLDKITKGQKARAYGTNALNVDYGVKGLGLTGQEINAIKKSQEIGNQFATSLALSQAEAITSATQLYQDTYDKARSTGKSDLQAKRIAAEAAAYTVSVNRANIALNMTSAARLMKAPDGVREAIKRRSWSFKQALKPDKDVSSNIRGLLSEGFQEAGEELINLYAEGRGAELAGDLLAGKNYDSYNGAFDALRIGKVLSQLATPEGRQAAVLGALGGVGQTMLTTHGLDKIGGINIGGSQFKFLGEKLEKVDEKGNYIPVTQDARYKEDILYRAGETVSKPIIDSDGNLKYDKGHVVTQENLDADYGILTHKTGDKIYDTKGEIVQEPTEEVQYEQEGKFLSKRERENVLKARQDKWIEDQINVSKKMVNQMNDVQSRTKNFIAVEAIDNITDPTAESSEQSYQNLAKYNLSKQGTEITNENLSKEVSELKNKSHKELMELREDVNTDLLHQQLYTAYNSGTIDHVVSIYEDIAKLDPEKAKEQGYKDSYKDDAINIIYKIRDLVNVYTEYNAKYDQDTAKELFMNRAHNESLFERRNQIEEQRTEFTKKREAAEREALRRYGTAEGIESFESINEKENAELTPIDQEINVLHNRLMSDTPSVGKKKKRSEMTDVEKIADDEQKEEEKKKGERKAAATADELVQILAEEEKERRKAKGEITKRLATLNERRNKITKKYNDDRLKSGIFTVADLQEIVNLDNRLTKVYDRIQKNDHKFALLRDRDTEIKNQTIREQARLNRLRYIFLTLSLYKDLQDDEGYVTTYNMNKKVTEEDLVANAVFGKILDRKGDINDNELMAMIADEISTYFKYLPESKLNKEKIFGKIKKLISIESPYQNTKKVIDSGISGTISESKGVFYFQPKLDDETYFNASDLDFFENAKYPDGSDMYKVTKKGTNLYVASPKNKGKKIEINSENFGQITILNPQASQVKDYYERTLQIKRNRISRANSLISDKERKALEIKLNIESLGQIGVFEPVVDPDIELQQEQLKQTSMQFQAIIAEKRRVANELIARAQAGNINIRVLDRFMQSLKQDIDDANTQVEDLQRQWQELEDSKATEEYFEPIAAMRAAIDNTLDDLLKIMDSVESQIPMERIPEYEELKDKIANITSYTLDQKQVALEKQRQDYVDEIDRLNLELHNSVNELSELSISTESVRPKDGKRIRIIFEKNGEAVEKLNKEISKMRRKRSQLEKKRRQIDSDIIQLSKIKNLSDQELVDLVREQREKSKIIDDTLAHEKQMLAAYENQVIKIRNLAKKMADFSDPNIVIRNRQVKYVRLQKQYSELVSNLRDKVGDYIPDRGHLNAEIKNLQYQIEELNIRMGIIRGTISSELGTKQIISVKKRRLVDLQESALEENVTQTKRELNIARKALESNQQALFDQIQSIEDGITEGTSEDIDALNVSIESIAQEIIKIDKHLNSSSLDEVNDMIVEISRLSAIDEIEIGDLSTLEETRNIISEKLGTLLKSGKLYEKLYEIDKEMKRISKDGLVFAGNPDQLQLLTEEYAQIIQNYKNSIEANQKHRKDILSSYETRFANEIANDIKNQEKVLNDGINALKRDYSGIKYESFMQEAIENPKILETLTKDQLLILKDKYNEYEQGLREKLDDQRKQLELLEQDIAYLNTFKDSSVYDLIDKGEATKAAMEINDLIDEHDKLYQIVQSKSELIAFLRQNADFFVDMGKPISETPESLIINGVEFPKGDNDYGALADKVFRMLMEHPELDHIETVQQMFNKVQELITDIQKIGDSSKRAVKNIELLKSLYPELEKKLEKEIKEEKKKIKEELAEEGSSDEVVEQLSELASKTPIKKGKTLGRKAPVEILEDVDNSVNDDYYAMDDIYMMQAEANSFMKASDPGKSAGIHQQYSIVKNPETGFKHYVDMINKDTGLPVPTSNKSSLIFYNTINKLSSGRLKDSKGKTLKTDDVYVMFINTDHQLIKDAPATATKHVQSFTDKGLSFNADNGTVVVKEPNKILNQATYLNITTEQREALKALKKDDVISISLLDLLYREDVVNLQYQSKEEEGTKRGKGIYITFADRNGNPIYVNDKTNTYSIGEKPTGDFDLPYSTIITPTQAQNIQPKNTFARYWSIDNKEKQAASWDNLRTLLIQRNPDTEPDKILVGTIYDHEGRAKKHFTIADVDDLEVSQSGSELSSLLVNRLRREISGIRKYRQAIIDSIAEGKPVLSKELVISDGLPLKRAAVNDKRNLKPLNQVITNKKEVLAITIQADNTQSIQFTLANGDIVQSRRKGKKGRVYILLDDGTITDVQLRKLNDTEQQLILDLVIKGFHAGNYQSKIIKTKKITDQNGKPLSSGQIRPIQRASDADILAGNHPLINDYIFWSGGKEDRSANEATIYVKRSDEPSDNKRRFLYYGVQEETGDKKETIKKPNKVDLEVLATDPAEQAKFKKWLSNRPLNIRPQYLTAKIPFDKITSVTGKNDDIQATVHRYSSYVDYLLENDIIYTDTISKAESVKAGFGGERTAHRYVMFGNESSLSTPDKLAKTKPVDNKPEVKKYPSEITHTLIGKEVIVRDKKTGAQVGKGKLETVIDKSPTQREFKVMVGNTMKSFIIDTVKQTYTIASAEKQPFTKTDSGVKKYIEATPKNYQTALRMIDVNSKEPIEIHYREVFRNPQGVIADETTMQLFVTFKKNPTTNIYEFEVDKDKTKISKSGKIVNKELIADNKTTYVDYIANNINKQDTPWSVLTYGLVHNSKFTTSRDKQPSSFNDPKSGELKETTLVKFKNPSYTMAEETSTPSNAIGGKTEPETPENKPITKTKTVKKKFEISPKVTNGVTIDLNDVQELLKTHNIKTLDDLLKLLITDSEEDQKFLKIIKEIGSTKDIKINYHNDGLHPVARFDWQFPNIISIGNDFGLGVNIAGIGRIMAHEFIHLKTASIIRKPERNRTEEEKEQIARLEKIRDTFLLDFLQGKVNPENSYFSNPTQSHVWTLLFGYEAIENKKVTTFIQELNKVKIGDKFTSWNENDTVKGTFEVTHINDTEGTVIIKDVSSGISTGVDIEALQEIYIEGSPRRFSKIITDNIDTFYEMLEKATDKETVSDMRADVNEFLASSFENTGFQKSLSQIKGEGDVSLFAYLVKLITDILNTGLDVKGTLLEDTVDAIMKLVVIYDQTADQEVEIKPVKRILDQQEQYFSEKTSEEIIKDDPTPSGDPINIHFTKGENIEFSNFYERPFFSEDSTSDFAPILDTAYEDKTGKVIKWNTVEGAYQASKLLYTKSSDYWTPDRKLTENAVKLIEKLSKATGYEAQKLGRSITGLDEKEWNSDNEYLMKYLISQSFEQNPKELYKLLATGNRSFTHKVGSSKWVKAFPRILSEVRRSLLNLTNEKTFNELNKDDDFSTRSDEELYAELSRYDASTEETSEEIENRSSGKEINPGDLPGNSSIKRKYARPNSKNTEIPNDKNDPPVDPNDVSGFPARPLTDIDIQHSHLDRLLSGQSNDSSKLLEALGYDADEVYKELKDKIPEYVEYAKDYPNDRVAVSELIKSHLDGLEIQEDIAIVLSFILDDIVNINSVVKSLPNSKTLFKNMVDKLDSKNRILNTVLTSSEIKSLNEGISYFLLQSLKDTEDVPNMLRKFNTTGELNKLYDYAFSEVRKTLIEYRKDPQLKESTLDKLDYLILKLNNIPFRKNFIKSHIQDHLTAIGVDISSEYEYEYADMFDDKSSIRYNASDRASVVTKMLIRSLPDIEGVKIDLSVDSALKQEYTLDMEYWKGEMTNPEISQADREDASFKYHALSELLDQRYIVEERHKLNSLGLPKLLDYERTYSYMLRELQGVQTIEEFENKLHSLVERETSPQRLTGIRSLSNFKEVIENIFNKNDVDSIAYSAQLVQDFGKTQLEHYITLIDNKEIYNKSANSNKSKDQIFRQFRTNYNIIIDRWNKDFPNTKGGKVFPPELYYEINNKLTNPTKESIAEVSVLLGFDFDNTVDFDYMYEGPNKFVKNSENITTVLRAIATYIKSHIGTNLDIYANDSPVRGRINAIRDYVANNANKITSNQFIDNEGKPIYAMALNHSISIAIDSMNLYSGSEEDLRKNLRYLFNPYTKHSVIRKHIIDGGTVELGVFNGMNVLSTKSNSDTDKLSPNDLLYQRLNGVLKEGIYPTIQAGDRSVTNSIRLLKTSGLSKIKLFENDSQAEDAFVGYLIDEMNTSIQYYQIINQVANITDNNYADLRVFESIIKKGDDNLYTKIVDLIKEKSPTKSFIESEDDIPEELRKPIRKAINKYFDDVTNKVYKLYNNSGLLADKPKVKHYLTKAEKEKEKKSFEMRVPIKIPGSQSKQGDIFGILGIDNSVVQEKINQEGGKLSIKKALIRDYTLNSIGMYVEQLKMFAGDPIIYGKLSSVFKRFKMHTSSRELSITGSKFDTKLNNNNFLYFLYRGERIRLSPENTLRYLTNSLSPNERATRQDGSNLSKAAYTTEKPITWGSLEILSEAGFRVDGKLTNGNMNIVTIADIKAHTVNALDNVDNIKIIDNDLVYLDKDGNSLNPETEVSIYKKAFAESFYKNGIHNEQDLNDKVNAYLSPYKNINEADGASIVSMDEYKEILIRSGNKWTSRHQKAYTKMIKGEILDSKDLMLFPVLKTQSVGHITDYVSDILSEEGDNDTMYIPSGLKHCVMPYIPSVFKGTSMERLGNYMKNNQIGMIQFISGNKFGTKLNANEKPNNFYENPNTWVSQTLPYKFFGIQVNPNFEEKTTITSSTQARKLIFSNMFDSGNLKEAFDFEVMKSFNDIQSKLINDDFDKLLKEYSIVTNPTSTGNKYTITNRKKFVELLIQEANSRNTPSAIKESISNLLIEIDRPADSVGKVTKHLYIEELLNGSKIEQILLAIVNNRVIKEKRRGVSSIQVASTGWELLGTRDQEATGDLINAKNTTLQSNFLKFYRLANNPLTGERYVAPAEIMMPLPKDMIHYVNSIGGLSTFNQKLDDLFNHIYSIENSEEYDEDDQLSEEEKNLLNIITVSNFRIPNQAFSSNDIFRVRKFYPSEQGISSVVPTELVAKAGMDFDYDKGNIYLPHYHLVGTNKKPTYISYANNSEQAWQWHLTKLVKTKQARLLFDQIKDPSFFSRLSQDKLEGINAERRTIKMVDPDSNEVVDANLTYEEIFDELDQLSAFFEDSVLEKAAKMFREDPLRVTNDAIAEALAEPTVEYDPLTGKETIVESTIQTRDQYVTNIQNLESYQYNDKKQLQNKLIDLQFYIFTHPDNYSQLIAPITNNFDYTNEESGVVWDIRFLQSNSVNKDEYLKNPTEANYRYYKNEFVKEFENANSSYTNVVEPLMNNDMFRYFLVGKQNIAVMAKTATHHALSQVAGLALSHGIEITDSGQVKNNSGLLLPFNIVRINEDKTMEVLNYSFTELVRKNDEQGKFQGYFKGNKKIISPNDKVYLNLGGSLNRDNHLITEILSSTINGYVDISENPFIFEVNGGGRTAPILGYMIRTGIPLKYIIRFINQPIVKQYTDSFLVNSSLIYKSFDISMNKSMILAKVMAEYGDGEKFLSTDEWYWTKDADGNKVVRGVDSRQNILSKLGLNTVSLKVIDDYQTYFNAYKSYSFSQHLKLPSSIKNLRLDSDGDNYVAYGTAYESSPIYREMMDWYLERVNNGDLSYENLGLYIAKKPKDIEHFNLKQMMILDMFIELENQTSKMREKSESDSDDTTGNSSSMMANLIRQVDRNRVDDEAVFISTKPIRDNTIIKPFTRIVTETNKMLESLYLINNPFIKGKMLEINSMIDNNYEISDKDSAKRRMVPEFINFILHTNFGKESYIDSMAIYNELVLGHNSKYSDENGNPISFLEFIQLVNSKRNLAETNNMSQRKLDLLRENIFIQELNYEKQEELFFDEIANSTTRNDRTNNSTLGLFNRKLLTVDHNYRADEFKELSTINKDVYNDLIRLSLAQSGIRISPINYHEFIPPSEFISYTIPQFNSLLSLSDQSLMDFLEKFEDSFWRRNHDLLPELPVKWTSYEGRSVMEHYHNTKHPLSKFPYAKKIFMNEETGEFGRVIYKRGRPEGNRVYYTKQDNIIGNSHRWVGYINDMTHTSFADDINDSLLLDPISNDMENTIPETIDTSRPLLRKVPSTSVWNKFYTRDDVRKYPDLTFLFGENLEYTSGSNIITNVDNDDLRFYEGLNYPNTTTAVLRGMFNAYPVITKKGSAAGDLFGKKLLENIQYVADDSLPLRKVISGGQTGVDRYGLEIGQELGYETGGTAAPNFEIEGQQYDSSLADFGVKAITQEEQIQGLENPRAKRSKYPKWLPRTEMNAKNADGTIYFTEDKNSAGLVATREYAEQHKGKTKFLLNPTAAQLKQWIKDNNIETLNIAGNRESKMSDSFKDKVKDILRKALGKSQTASITEENFDEDLKQEFENFKAEVDINMENILRASKPVVQPAGGYATSKAALPRPFAEYLQKSMADIGIYTTLVDRDIEYPGFFGLLPVKSEAQMKTETWNKC